MAMVASLHRRTLLGTAALLVLSCVPGQDARGVSCTWNPSSGNWGVAGNWSCGQVPTGPGGDGASIGLSKTVTINTPQSIFTLVNAGTITIDAFTFTLQGGGSTINSGTINIGGTSTAALQAANNIDNTGGVINIADGSVFNQLASVVTGGTINASGSGAVVAFSNGSNILSGVALNAPLDVVTNASARERIGNGMTLNGVVTIGNGGIVSLDSTLGASNPIGGSGSFNLTDAGARLAVEGSGTTTLGANIVIHGQGNVGTPVLAGGDNAVINNGRISADVSGGTLNLAAPANGTSGYTNNGLIDARNGGTLLLSAGVANGSGTISAQTGSSVVHNGVTISGGQINTTGTGVFSANSSGNNILSGVTLSGVLDLSSIANARERIANGATLSGSVNIANGGILVLDSTTTSGSNQTVAGTTTINLNDPGARVTVEGSGATTLASGLTIRGQGNIGTPVLAGGTNVLTNNGVISADVNGGTLNIAPPANFGSLVLGGTLQAISGGTLLLSTNTVANPGSQIVAGTGSSVVQNGVSITGTFTETGGGLFAAAASGSNILSAVTASGAIDASSIANARERIGNGLTFNGSINVANGGVVSLDSSLGASNAIAGNVVFNLNDAGARLAVEGAGTTTLGAGVVVRGQGNFGTPILAGGSNTLTNNGRVSADVGGGTLSITTPANAGTFVNNGILEAVNGGSLLLLTSISANPGSQIVARTGSTVVQSGVTLNGTLGSFGTGAFLPTSNGNNILNAATLNGTLDATSIANARERIGNGFIVNGAVNIGNGGIVSLDSTLGATNVIGGSGVFNLNDAGARLGVEGAGSTTLGANVTVRGQGNFGTPALAGGTNTVTNAGLFSADVAGGTLAIATPANAGSFVNAGTLQAIGGGTLQLATAISNGSGLISAATGSTVLQRNVSITGGTVQTSGTGTLRASSDGGNILNAVTLNGTLDLTSIASARERIANGLTLNGAVNIANGGILSLDSSATAGGNQTIGGTGVINLNDPGARLAIEGTGAITLGPNVTLRGQGNVGTPALAGGSNTLINNGLILADGGLLTLAAPASSGSLAGTGTLQVNGGAMNLATGTNSIQGALVIGGAGSTLNLNTANLTLTRDYTNAQSGAGNAFDRHAAVSGTGLILAGGDVAQAITGSSVTNGNTATATLTLGNVRVGTTPFSYQIANTGSTGPTLRGAIQTSVNGANLTDTRLSGTGVTAGNYVTGGPGGSTGLSVVFTAATAGALAPLVGQAINLRSNFDNIGDQKLNIVLGSGAAAYNAAVGSATSPVQVANQRVGGSGTAAVNIANTAAAGSFSEDLNASVSGSSGQAFANGTITGRVAGTNNTGAGAINAGVDTSAAGARSGTVTIAYQTAGTVGGVSNGLGVAGAGSQTITVNGNVYQIASGAIQTSPLNFGTVQVGQPVSQNLVIRNTATGPAGFVEDLNASFGIASGTGAGLISGSGSLAGILAGTNSTAANGTMTVSVNTSAAASVNGSIAVNFTSAGAVNAVSNGLGTAAAGSASYGVAGTIQTNGTVINQAIPVLNTPTVDLGAVRVGAAAPSAFVSLTNQATTTPQAALNAAIASNGAPVTAVGSVSLLAPGATSANQLQVGMGTATAGNFTGANAGSATLTLVSDASNVGNCAPNCQLALSSQQVSVSGKVYTPAVAQLNTTVVDFGIVHKGEVVAPRAVSVTNAAAASALNDDLRGTLGGATGPFIASGTLAGLGPHATDATSFSTGLNTSNAGVFTGSATAAFKSHDPDLADLDLGSAPVTLKAQVNNFALAALQQTAGAGTLTLLGNVYTLDLGTLHLGAGPLSQTFAVLNGAAGPADLLRGAFDTGGIVNPEFVLSGFGAFQGLAAGQSQNGYTVTLEDSTAGQFSDTIVLHSSASNASGYDAALPDTILVLRGDVEVTAAVPEPETYALMLGGLALLVARVRRRGTRFETPLR